MPTSDPRALAVVAEDLTKRVNTLTHHLDLSQRQVQRMRVLSWVTAFLAVASVVGVLASAYLWHEVRETGEANTTNAVQSCRNANETREAQVRLWSFVIDVSLAGGEETPAQRAQLEQLRTWIHQLFAARDCSDLSKEYVPPSPPNLLDDIREGAQQ